MKKSIVVFLSLIAALGLNAQPLSEQEAMKKARQFFQGKEVVSLDEPARARGSQEAKPFKHLYLFNAADNGGFVILSGDSRAREILGYSHEGHLDYEQMPDNMKWWLSRYDEAIAGIPADQVVSEPTTRADGSKTDVAPMMSYSWNQMYPYNMYCPPGTLSGCVPTAMAQMLYYHRYPETLPALEGYTDNNGNMLDAMGTYHMDYSSGSGESQAALVRYCGQAIKANYGANMTGAFHTMIATVLARKFGLDEGVHHVYRDSYNAYEWDDLLYQELKEGRPFILSGQVNHNREIGHTFICHGYSEGYYAVNWGWGGSQNGYFAMSALITMEADYSTDLSACIGIRPPAGGSATYPAFSVEKFQATSSLTVTRASANNSFNFDMAWNVRTSMLDAARYNVSIAILCPDGSIKLIFNYNESEYAPSFTYSHQPNVSIASMYGDGTYKIFLIYKQPFEEDWHYCQGFSWRYIQAVISGNTMTLTNYPTSDDPYPTGPYPPYYPINPDPTDPDPTDPDPVVPDEPEVDWPETNVSVSYPTMQVQYTGEYFAVESTPAMLATVIQDQLGMSQADFDSYFWADCFLSSEYVEVPEADASYVVPYAYNFNEDGTLGNNWYDMLIYNFGDELGNGGTPPASGEAGEPEWEYVCVAAYCPNKDGEGNHVISYEFDSFDIENMIAGQQSPITFTRWVRFSAKYDSEGNVEAPYRFVWLKLPIEISWGSEDPDAIQSVGTDASEGYYYNLGGQRVGSLGQGVKKPSRKGIYILNGKKVVVR